MLPFFWPVRRRSIRDGESRNNALDVMRGIFLGLVSELLLIFVVLFAIKDQFEPHDRTWFVAVIGLDAALALARLPALERKVLSADTEARLITIYRAVFFIGVGLSVSIALWGFVGVWITGHIWMYPVALALSLLALTRMAPSRRNIDRLQRQIDEIHPDLSLGRALTTVPGWPSPAR